jgi:predicted phosphohydrolase
MNIWGISDLHLSFAQPDRRERYAARWRDHATRIEKNWLEVVEAGDLVLLPGDLSMARNHRELQRDLEWLHRLPGTKVLSRGNHDRWWNDLPAVRRLLRRSQLAVDSCALATHGVLVCGAMGSAVAPADPMPDETETMERELKSFNRGLDEAAILRGEKDQPLYALCHYPPFDAYARPGPWVEHFERSGVSACLYGHIHVESQWPCAVQGTVRGVRYYCVAADAIGFRPIRIDSFPAKP